MRISVTVPWVVWILLTGCASDVALRRYDNPTIRRMQEQETARHLSDDHVMAAMKKHVGDRVSLVYTTPDHDGAEPYPGISSGGRAAALTSDGYFITAYHVVQDVPFHIKKTKVIKQPPAEPFKTSDMNQYFVTSRYAGGLVWCDPDLDLAILKFPLTNWPHFTDLKVPPQRGDTLFTADDEGRLFAPVNEQGISTMESAVGNGAFFAAGQVRDTAIHDPPSRSM